MIHVYRCQHCRGTILHLQRLNICGYVYLYNIVYIYIRLYSPLHFPLRSVEILNILTSNRAVEGLCRYSFIYVYIYAYFSLGAEMMCRFIEVVCVQ